MEIKTQVIEVKMNGGVRGLQGIPGPKGETGATGPKGETGQAGVGIETIVSGLVTQDDDYTVTPITFKKTDGQKIIINVKTKNGEKGETGATFTPVLNEQGVLSWTNDKGLPNPTSVNIKGEKGETGSPYLIYIEPFDSTSIPNLNDTFHCMKNNFSREPIIDDVFLLLWVSALGDYPAYLVMSKVTGFEDNMVLCTILNFYQVGAENGADGVSITDILSGNPTVQDEYTITPIEIKKSDNTSLTMNVKTKNGSNGATFIPALNEQGILSWTNDKNLPNPESISVKGDAGLPYLIYSEPMGSTNIPRFDQYVSCNLGKFNRTPKVGDIFYMLWVPAYGDLFPDYIVTAKIVNVSDTSAGCNVLYFSKIGGTGITDVSAGTPTQDDDYTITPITFNKSDNSNVTVNVKAKNGVGVPNGGTTGQVLVKASDNDKDTQWVDNEKYLITSLSDIGITITEGTTLDAIVTAVPNGKTLQVYLTTDNATVLYNSTGGRGNIPATIAGLLTVEKRSENDFAFIKYQTTESSGYPDNNPDGGVYYTTKLNVYRDWTRSCSNYYLLQKDVFTGRYWFDGKPIYRSVIYIPTLTINEETQIRITHKSIRDLISFNGSFRYEDDYRVPWNFYNTYNTQRSHCYSWVQGYNFLYSTNLEGCVDGYVIIEFTSN